MHDKANVAWVHATIDALILLDEYPLLAPLRCTSDEEVLAIIRKHTSKLLENEDVAIRTNVINEIAELDRNRRYTESAEEMRQVSIALAEKHASNSTGTLPAATNDLRKGTWHIIFLRG